MLRIALPNKGSLAEGAARIMSEAGYRTKRLARQLHITDRDNDVEIFFLRPRDIAVYVDSGTIQAGITGRDLLLDSGVSAHEHRALGFGSSTFRFAGPAESVTRVEDLNGLRIATSFDNLVTDYLFAHEIAAEVVHLDGAVESSVQLGVADAIADVVETGSTLAAAGLTVFGAPLLESEAVLVTTDTYAGLPEFQALDERLRGVLVGRSYVIIDYNIPAQLLEKAVSITPGIESPTVSHLQDSNWRAVRVLAPRREANRLAGELYRIGARGILVSDLLFARL